MADIICCVATAIDTFIENLLAGNIDIEGLLSQLISCLFSTCTPG